MMLYNLTFCHPSVRSQFHSASRQKQLITSFTKLRFVLKKFLPFSATVHGEHFGGRFQRQQSGIPRPAIQCEHQGGTVLETRAQNSFCYCKVIPTVK